MTPHINTCTVYSIKQPSVFLDLLPSSQNHTQTWTRIHQFPQIPTFLFFLWAQQPPPNTGRAHTWLWHRRLHDHVTRPTQRGWWTRNDSGKIDWTFSKRKWLSPWALFPSEGWHWPIRYRWATHTSDPETDSTCQGRGNFPLARVPYDIAEQRKPCTSWIVMESSQILFFKAWHP